MIAIACMGRNDMTPSFLHECFDADFERGFLTWRRRPRGHFQTTRSWSAWNTRFAGRTAGGPHKEGYVAVTMTCEGGRQVLLVHRVLWCMRAGEWPPGTVDHKNCIRTDNRQDNLRLAGYADQNANRPVSRRSKVGLKGVCICPTTGRFKAQLHRDGKNHHLGRFDTAEEAHAAYVEASRRVHGEFARW